MQRIFNTEQTAYHLMRTDASILPSILFFCLAHCVCANAQIGNQLDGSRTNVFSLTQGDIRDETGDEESYYFSCLTHHVVMPETLPSNLDTNGNWGPETNGLQLSLRFPDKKFTPGGQVPAVIILRNLEMEPRTLLLTNSGSFYFKLLVRYDSNPYLLERKQSIPRETDYNVPITGFPHGLGSSEFAPRSEKMIVLNLRRIFDLNRAGHYTAKATCRVYSQSNESVPYEVMSGLTSFTILDATNSL